MLVCTDHLARALVLTFQDYAVETGKSAFEIQGQENSPRCFLVSYF